MFSDNRENDNLDNDFLNEFRQRIASSSFDDFEEKEKERAKRAKNIFWGVLSGVVVAAAVGWVILSSDKVEYNENNIPVIRKSAKLVKVKPEKPGGMDIPNRDKEVYEIMVAKTDDVPEIEKLLPAEEQPTYPEIKIKETIEKATDSKVVDDIATQVEKIEKKVAKKEKLHKKIAEQADNLVSAVDKINNKVIEIKKAPVAVVVDEDLIASEVKKAVVSVKEKKQDEFAELVNAKEAKSIEVKNKPVSLIKSMNKPIVLTKVKASTVKDETGEGVRIAKTVNLGAAVSGDWQIQLMSSKNKEAVNTSWNKLSKKYNELSKLVYEIEEANLGPKGIFYRLKAGAFKGRKSALDACNRLKASGGGCIVKQKK